MAKVGSLLPLQEVFVAGNALAAKRAVMRDLHARAEMLKDSARDMPHEEQGRTVLLVAVRVLEVAMDDYERNLVCE